MALKFIDLTPEVSGSHKVDFQRESKRTYIAYFGVDDDENYVTLRCGLILGTRHPTDFAQVLHSIDVDCLGRTTWEGDNSDAMLWSITANYGTWNFAEKGEPSKAGNPLLMPVKFRLEWEKVPEPIWVDVNGDPILNTAGDPFDPPIELDNLIGILTVRRNEAMPDLPVIMALALSLNEAPWNGFDAKCVRLAPIALPELEYAQETDTYYYPMTYVFEINFRTWKKRPLNSGYRQITPTQINPNRVSLILDDGGQPLQSPGLLSKSGFYLKPPVNKDNLVIGSFDIHPTIDYGVFNLDNLFTPPAET